MLLQNDFAEAEIASPGSADRFLAQEAHRGFEDVMAALWTFPHRHLTREVDFCGGLAIALVRPEIKLRFVICVELKYRGKRLAGATAETLQGTNLTFLDKLLDFFRLEQAAGDDFPDREIAFDTLKRLVAFVHLTATLRTGDFEHAEIA